MNFETIFTSINKYARDYIFYLVGFFDHRRHATSVEHLKDKDGLIIIHSLISLTLGVYLRRVFVDKAHLPNNDDILLSMAHQIGYWFFFSVVIFALARLLASSADFVDALSLAMRIFPPAYMIGMASILFVTNAIYAFLDATPEGETIRGWWGLIMGAVVFWLLAIYALRYGLYQAPSHTVPVIAEAHKWQRRIVVAVIAILLLLSEVINLEPIKMLCAFRNVCGADQTVENPRSPKAQGK
jgi:hypothetical protein